MFGHHSLSETSFATDAIDLFFTPTGVSVTGATFSSDYTVNASANVTISQGVLGDISLLADGNSSFFYNSNGRIWNYGHWNCIGVGFSSS